MRFNLTQAKTKAYVTQLLAGDGKKRQIRLTHAGLVSRVRRLRESLGAHGVLRKAEALAVRLTDEQRAQLVDEVEQLLAVLGDVSRAVRSPASRDVGGSHRPTRRGERVPP